MTYDPPSPYGKVRLVQQYSYQSLPVKDRTTLRLIRSHPNTLSSLKPIVPASPPAPQ